ncbi:MAG: bifunctional riboflavin kinase/FAD synthetase [Eudoraea sp.]|nr:bifunctional riboflavin kinase/FAD synthetase [Eudoraea sp.]
MDIVQSIAKYDKHQSSILTIGTFDGVHIGHKRILDQLIKSGQKSGLRSTVLTFFPHPRMVLQQDSGLKLLNTLEEKISILEDTGLECLVIHPFSKDFSRLTAEEFVREHLVEQLQAKKIIIGYDHRFGRNRNADIDDLKAFGEMLEFEVTEIPVQEIDEVSVSSTKIRSALAQGDMKTANAFLGYAYMLSGTIRRGKGLGRQLNFPTANLHIVESYKLIPKNGVYVVFAHIDNSLTYGMMNIGFNPTVEGKRRSIEIHFFELQKDLYDLSVRVHVLHRLRDEKKFDSLKALQQQLDKDKNEAMAFISGL